MRECRSYGSVEGVMRNHQFLLRPCPDRLGRPGAKGAALQASEAVFRRVRNGLFVFYKRQRQQSGRETETRKGWKR
jgi:hypothetical protein